MSAPNNPEASAAAAVKVLALLNRLSLNAFRSKTKEALIFQIVNDTIQLTPYNRAVLWDLTGSKPKILSISGQIKTNKSTGLVQTIRSLITDLKNPQASENLSNESFRGEVKAWEEYHGSATAPNVYWFPIFSGERLVMGFWLERWQNRPWHDEEIEMLSFLMQAYGSAYEKFLKKFSLIHLTKKRAYVLTTIIFLAMFLIRVPLRVVAPCEVAPKDPTLITAPLNGIVAKMVVRPGQDVEAEDLLFVYDKRVPLQELKVAQKQVEIIQSELHRATTLAFEQRKPTSYEESKPLTQLATLRLELQKEQARLELAEYHSTQLEVSSPISGVVMLDNPEQWRGKPVNIGERVLIVSDPNNTKVKMWLPEDDNVVLDHSKAVKVFLNVRPGTSYEARISYIADYTEITDKGVTSFLAEAEWDEQPGLKLGLKGTAILYGENVSLFYWLFRRPWAATRNFLGF